MTEFIQICAVVGLITMYIISTGVFGCIIYKVMKTNEESFDISAAFKGMIVSYGVGLIIFMCVGTYFLIYRG